MADPEKTPLDRKHGAATAVGAGIELMLVALEHILPLWVGPTLWGLLFAVGFLLFLYGVSPLIAAPSRRWQHQGNRRMIALAGMAICGAGFLVFAGAYFWPGAIQPILPPQASPRSIHPSILPNRLTEAPVEFLRNMQVSGPYPGNDVVRLIGFSNVTTDKLRVFVDYYNGLMPSHRRERIEIGALGDIVRDMQVIYPIIRKKISPNYPIYYFLGAGIDHPLSLGPSRVRVVVIGPDGQEQYYIFSLYLADGHVEITPSNSVYNPEFLIRDDSGTPW